jgi:DNA polymerase-3 subunit gamma/tau
MSYLALARRYRPGDFDNILSQPHITTTLKNAVSSGRISHAYLFCGPRGTGKTTTARVLAKALNCEKGPTPEPCGECTVCTEIARGSSPDVFEIDAASNRGIDDIRELRENVRYSPVGGRYKIYIIDEIHRLTREAFDALLKTLEEPPSHVVFVFATTDPQALPATILSRTQRYDFKRIPISALAEAVNSVAHKEGLTVDPNAAILIARKADGSLRDALSLLDQLISFGDSHIELSRAAEVLGLVKSELLFNLAGAVINHDSAAALKELGGFIESGGDAQELADALSGFFRTLLLVKNEVGDPEILELDRAEIEKAGGLVGDVDAVDLLRYFSSLADYKGSVKQGLDPIYALEITVTKMATMDRAVSLEELLRGARPASKAAGAGLDPPGMRNPGAREGSVKKTSRDDRSAGSAGNNPRPETQVKPPPREGSLDLGTIESEWDDFCQFVFRQNKTVFAHLSICRPVELSGGRLTLVVKDNGSFHFEQLSRRDKKASLEFLLGEFFSSDMKLKLAMEVGKPAKPSSVSAKRAEKRKFEGSPAAKKLFDLLDGEIIGE